MNPHALTPSHRHTVWLQLSKDVLSIFKLRISFMIMVTALVGMAVSTGESLGVVKVLILAVCVMLA
jgi:heme O synthase-like polyprenyltransferase